MAKAKKINIKAKPQVVYTCACRTCKRRFIITDSEKRWYENRGLPLPTHCKTCRKGRKLLRAAEKMFNSTI